MIIFISSNVKKHFNTYVDFLDYNWIKYFEKKNYNFHIIPNSKKNFLKISKKIKPNLIILAGGNDLFHNNKYVKNRLKVEKDLINYGISKKIPILGVCRGMQLINHFFEGKISKVKGHMRKKNRIIFKQKIFSKKYIDITSYHNYGIKKKDMASKFDALATDKNENIEMFKHKKLNILGVMWHPEREKSNLIDLIFKKLIK